jgi:hypothetical protein
MGLPLIYAAPVARILASFFGQGNAIDLGLAFDDPTKLPTAPRSGTDAEWTAWLRRCDEVQLGLVLSVASSIDPDRNQEKVVAARQFLMRQATLAEGNFARLTGVYVNRTQLLQRLGELLGGDRRILRVNGARGDGKTFTRQILRSFLNGTERVIELDIPEHHDLGALARWTLHSIRGELVALPAADDSTPLKWPEQLASLVVREATRDSGITCWLVFDRCAAAGEKQDVGSFLRRLAEEIERNAQHPRAPRLVLLEAPTEMTQRRRALEEPISPVQSTDIDTFFRGRSVPEVKRAALVSEVLEAMEKRPPTLYRLEAMQGCIIDILNREGYTDGL